MAGIGAGASGFDFSASRRESISTSFVSRRGSAWRRASVKLGGLIGIGERTPAAHVDERARPPTLRARNSSATLPADSRLDLNLPEPAEESPTPTPAPQRKLIRLGANVSRATTRMRRMSIEAITRKLMPAAAAQRAAAPPWSRKSVVGGARRRSLLSAVGGRRASLPSVAYEREDTH